MEPHQNHPAGDPVAIVPTESDVSRDPVPTLDPTPSPVASTVPRHQFTMTVEQVSAELYQQGFGRDDRTIQRWCKAGKLRAVVDEAHGDRYLIDPASLHDMLATLAAERDSRSARPFLSSRPIEPAAMPSRPSYGTQPTYGNFSQPTAHVPRPDDTLEQTPHAASETDEAATLKLRIAELEKENMMLTVDKQVREQMVDYMKEQFGSMLDQALDRSMEVGQLKAEVFHLRAQLPAPMPTPEYEPHRFTPQQVRPQPEPVHTETT